MVLAADGVDGDQFAVALILQARLVACGLGLGQGCAGAVVIRLERRRVDAEQHVALFDVAALTVHALEHHAGHTGADLGGTRGEDTAIELGADGQRLDFHRLDADGAGRCLLFFEGAVIARAQGQRDGKQR
ncbi:hypothetical protein D3C84_966590 [compost metagenome]